MNEISENKEDSILYDLQVFSEWSQEQDVINKTTNEPCWNWKNIIRYLKKNSAAYYVADWLNQQLPWLFAVGSNGKAVAILQDCSLEIRTSRDNYAVPVGKNFTTNDQFKQWRKLQWSPDGTLLAVGHSSGSIDVYDLLATHLFVIPFPKGNFLNITSNEVPSNGIVGLAFVDVRTENAHWSYELLSLDYFGQLRAFFVSPTQGFEESHTFSFAAHMPNGVTAFCADRLRNLLVMASPVVTSSKSNNSGNWLGVIGAKYGLTSWKLIDEFPFYIQTPNEINQLPNSWLRSFKKKHYGDTIVKLSSSADDSFLAAIHLSGTISIWSIPALNCKQFWPLDRQPGFDVLNPSILQLPTYRRMRSPAFQNPFKFYPVDITWWSADSLVIARFSGAISVCAAVNFRNKLGSSAEFFEGSPRISQAFDSTFLGLECEVKVKRKRLQPTTDGAAAFAYADDEFEVDLSEGEEKTFMAHRTFRLFLSWITDSERYLPPRKRPALLSKTYRLLGFKRTTPDELYIWKLDAEEYGEALALARVYGLDCDLVYQRQWRNAPATIATIHDYLGKVTKRNWVLRECLECVPKNVDAARELLLYGLKNTDLSLIADEEGADRKKTSWSPLKFQKMESEILKREEQKTQWLAKIDFDSLTVQQKMLITTRRRLLHFLDLLSIYEIILGGPLIALQRFDSSFFKTFRSQTALESTIGFARQGEWQAVAVMFTFYGPETLPHRLAVCSCFPETVPPSEYRTVLPECDNVGEKVILWEQQELRKSDWCECPVARTAVDVDHLMEKEIVHQFYNQEAKHLRSFHSTGEELTTDLVSLWYGTRAADIEKQSMLVENALDLIKLGLERNVPHLEHIYHQLLTLETLVYDLQQDRLTLEKVNAMSELSVCELIVKSCDVDSFLAKLRLLLMPYLRRLDALQPGRSMELLRGLLVVRSQSNLDWALQVCANSKADQTSPVVVEASFLISLALECIYACQKNDQLEVAFTIYECLPERPIGSATNPLLTQLHDQLDQLQSHLEAAGILKNYDVAILPASILAKQNDVEQVEQLFVRLTRTALGSGDSSTESRMEELLEDMLELQRKVFYCITPQLCYEILVSSLLSSAKKDSIASASLMLQLHPNVVSQKLLGNFTSKIPFDRSKQLILQAAEEYITSSENLTDPCLELARSCLNLVTVHDENIQEEKDLIDAFQLLYEYGLDMPPLKIRLSRNRIFLIDQVLKQANKAYKNSSRLLRLGHLLRVCKVSSFTNNEDRRNEFEGQLYTWIAKTALKKQDVEYACQMCEKLRLDNHSVGWKVCSQLASLDEVTDSSMKLKLTSFSLVYCPAECIEDLLKLRWKAEQSELDQECTKQILLYINL